MSFFVTQLMLSEGNTVFPQDMIPETLLNSSNLKPQLNYSYFGDIWKIAVLQLRPKYR